jgi:tol-pal system protein YbgF
MMAKRTAVVVGVALWVVGPMLAGTLHAAEPLPDRRAVSRPVVVGPGGGSDAALRQSLVDMMQQLEQTQSELRQLRDAVEVQNHELEQLKSGQRELIGDLDRRLSAVERGAGAAATPPAAAAGTAPPAARAAPRATAAVSTGQQEEYEAAFNLMKQGHYDSAVKAFRAFLAKHPNSGLADNAQYWVAEGNYVLRNYKLALEEFNKVVTNYPRSPKLGDAMLKIGYVYYELGAYDKSNKALHDVVARFPNTTVAKLASTRLDKMKKEGR